MTSGDLTSDWSWHHVTLPLSQRVSPPGWSWHCVALVLRCIHHHLGQKPTRRSKSTEQTTMQNDIYTQSQKKHTMESCISFWEECRLMNFVVHFILPVLLVTKCKTIWHLWMGFFCDLFQILVTKCDPAGGTWPWPSVTVEDNEFMVRFFCILVFIHCMFISFLPTCEENPIYYDVLKGIWYGRDPVVI